MTTPTHSHKAWTDEGGHVTLGERSRQSFPLSAWGRSGVLGYRYRNGLQSLWIEPPESARRRSAAVSIQRLLQPAFVASLSPV